MLKESVGIMIVDDDEVDVMNIKRVFKNRGVNNRLYVANNGIEALDMLRGNGDEALSPVPKIVLLDINMPKMNGIEFLRQLRADPQLRPLCVIILTTSDEERDRIAAYSLNVSGYVLKPVDPDEFVDAVDTLHRFWSLIRLP